MNLYRRVRIGAGALALFAASAAAAAEYGDPRKFESAIVDFELADRESPPPEGAIVCVGSSSMRGWHLTLADDLAPLTVIPRGFGGSTMNDALHYVGRIVIPYKPRAIVLYEGDNDIARGIPRKMILSTFRAFARAVHESLPKTRIYVLSIKPSISRWDKWPLMEAANRLLRMECERDDRMVFVDVANPMLGNDGKPRKELFLKDDLHMTREGYVLWRDILRPVLMKTELDYEAR